MPNIPPLLSLGIMTGNSLDGVDAVLTRFTSGTIEDIAHHYAPYPVDLREQFQALRKTLLEKEGDIKTVSQKFPLKELAKAYTHLVATTVEALQGQAGLEADVIGLHGQTCGHMPPSISDAPYTIQVGDGQKLADLTGRTVVYDFRSDDIINGGEGAPLAPMHMQHLFKSMNLKAVAFCNAGNTGNIALITPEHTVGWDTGPFNHYPDHLMRASKNLPYDEGGARGATGTINLDFLAKLFETAIQTPAGENFLTLSPPKSSDPQWYQNIESDLPFEDHLRTCEYFAAYCFVYSLKFMPKSIEIPQVFLLCGGGWKNKTTRRHFEGLLTKDFENNPILPAHRDIFQALNTAHVQVDFSDAFGFRADTMEARLFADMAVSRLKGVPFTTPAITGTSCPTVCGIIRYPEGKIKHASPAVKEVLEICQSHDATPDPALRDPRWNRAVKGWQNTL